MPTIRVTQNTKASTQACWDLMADFGNIDFFNPNLSKSYLLSDDEQIGVGTQRQCDLSDGKNYIREEIVEWKPGEYYVINIYEGTMPIDNPVTKLGVIPSSNGGSRVYMEFSYTPRFGLVGKLMNVLMLKRMMTGMLKKVLEGLAEKAELAQKPATIAA